MKFPPLSPLALAKSAALIGSLVFLTLLPLLTRSNYVLGISVSGLIFTVAAAALNLVYGYAGLLSFAQLGFWGIGAYASALVVMDYNGSFWLGVVVAGIISALVGLAIGFPILRIKTHAFVVATITFTLLCGLVARDWISVTRGPLGIPGLPPPKAFGHSFQGSAAFYYIALSFALLTLTLLYVFGTSRIGLTLKAIKQNEPLTESQGITPLWYKLSAFTIAASITGMAGGIYAFHLQVVDPLIFDFYYMQTFLIIVIIGGAGSFWSVLLAGAAMVILPEFLRFSNDLRMVIYGAILIAAMLGMPRGLSGWLEDRRFARWRATLQ